ncbi:MAG: hypothetical protein KME08_09385 [Aphanothece sp. CMT-3BRIN-NPC111]|jgi:hypothetical protein|nr:hypothetical protein [Aphanothece sp. CMT-3BRIN-NPC111]
MALQSYLQCGTNRIKLIAALFDSETHQILYLVELRYPLHPLQHPLPPLLSHNYVVLLTAAPAKF